jgi:hypothetical protein
MNAYQLTKSITDARALGLTTLSQLSVLTVLNRKTLTMSGISRTVGISRCNATLIVDTLEKLGLAHRPARIPGADRRQVCAELTPHRPPGRHRPLHRRLTMIPVETIDCNFTFTAPAGMTPEQCGNLHCRRETGMITSWWRPSPQELTLLAAGALVDLTVLGHSHPAISLSVTPTPFGILPHHPNATPPSSARDEEFSQLYPLPT